MPEIRPFRALRYEPEIGRRSRDRRGAAVRRHPPGRAPGAAAAQPAQHRPPGPAHRRAGRRARRQVSPRGADARRVAQRRHVPQGSAAVDLRLRAVVSGSRAPTSSGRSAASSRGCGWSRSAPKNGVLPHERTLAAPREDRYMLLRATGVNTSPVIGLYEDPDGRAPALLAQLTDGHAGDRRPRRRRHPPSPVGRPGGRRRRRGPGRRRGAAARAGAVAADPHRGRPSSLRDGAALPRRAADDALLRRGSRVRLPADAVPRHGGAAHRAADASDRPQACPTRAVASSRRPRAVRRDGGGPATALDAEFDGGGAVARWPRSLRPLDARRRRDPDGSRREAFEPLAAGGQRRAPPRGRDDSSRSALEPARRASTPTRSRPGGWPTRARRREALDAVDAAHRRRRRGIPPRADAGRVDRRDVARAGEVMPQKSTYFYPKALSGLLVNPARMVRRHDDSDPEAATSADRPSATSSSMATAPTAPCACPAGRRRAVPPHGRPVRKDEIELPRARHLHRVVVAGTPVAAQTAAVRPRRARRLVAVGALPRVLRQPRLGRPRPQPAQPLLVADGRPDVTLLRQLHRRRRRGDGPARDPTRSSSVTAWARCSP